MHDGSVGPRTALDVTDRDLQVVYIGAPIVSLLMHGPLESRLDSCTRRHATMHACEGAHGVSEALIVGLLIVSRGRDAHLSKQASK